MFGGAGGGGGGGGEGGSTACKPNFKLCLFCIVVSVMSVQNFQGKNCNVFSHADILFIRTSTSEPGLCISYKIACVRPAKIQIRLRFRAQAFAQSDQNHHLAHFLDSQVCKVSSPTCPGLITVEPQWLEHLWDHGNSFETWVVRATEG